VKPINLKNWNFLLLRSTLILSSKKWYRRQRHLEGRFKQKIREFAKNEKFGSSVREKSAEINLVVKK